MKRATGKEMPAENNNTALASMNVKFSWEKIDIKIIKNNLPKHFQFICSSVKY